VFCPWLFPELLSLKSNIELIDQQKAYMVVPRFPRRSPKLILRTPLETAFWKTPTPSNADERINKITSRKKEC
jgi:hypothetical protein